MQLAVVAVVLPELLLLSWTPAYSVSRVTGAAVAIVAAIARVTERIMQQPNMTAKAIGLAAQHGMFLAACLWAGSALAWLFQGRARPSTEILQRSSLRINAPDAL